MTTITLKNVSDQTNNITADTRERYCRRLTDMPHPAISGENTRLYIIVRFLPAEKKEDGYMSNLDGTVRKKVGPKPECLADCGHIAPRDTDAEIMYGTLQVVRSVETGENTDPEAYRQDELAERIIAAQSDELILSDLIRDNKQWILRCSFKATKRYVTDSDDEWSIALIAFSEAVNHYQPEKGNFYAFASMVIRRRLYDFMSSESRHRDVIAVDPGSFSGNVKEESADRTASGIQNQLMKTQTADASDDTAARAREEIEEIQDILSEYGFSFFDLTEQSPKAKKTKLSCARAVCVLVASAILMAAMRLKKKLPAKALHKESGVTFKILDRYRKYIITSAEILDGPFPILASYIEFIRKEGMA